MPQHDEWGPWIEHDASPCPIAVGTWCEVICRFRSGREESLQGRLGPKSKACPSWIMPDHLGPWNQVIRYRIRKPRGLTILQELIENLPTPTEKEEA